MFGWNLGSLIWGDGELSQKVTPENFHKTMHEFVHNCQVLFAKFLEENLDKNIFQYEFDTNTKDKSGKYILSKMEEKQIESLANKNIRRYKLFNNLLIDLQSLLAETEALHNYAIHKDSSYYLLTNGWEAKNRFFGLLNSYGDVYNSIVELGIANFFHQLNSNFSFKKFIELVGENSLISLDTTKEILEENFFYNSLITNYEEWSKIFDNSVNWLESVSTFLKKFTDATQQTTIQSTLNTISNLIIHIKKFSKTNQNRKDLLYFIYKIAPDVVDLLHNFPISCIEFTNDSQEHIISTTEDLNDVLKDICLQLDKQEMELYLNENFFVEYSIKGYSIKQLATRLHEWIKTFGYDFKPGDTFPYLEAKATQRERFKTLDFPNNIDRELLDRRIASINLEVAIAHSNNYHEESLQQEKNAKAKLAKVNYLIDNRIASLTKEFKASPGMLLKKDKTFILSALKIKLNAGINLETALDQLESDPVTKVYLPSLFQGRTGEVVTQLRNTLANKLYRLDLIDIHMQTLLNEKDNKDLIKSCCEEDFEKRFLTLSLLKDLLAIPGFTLEDAKIRMCGKFHEDYKILLEHEKTLLQQLRDLDEAISIKTTELILNDNEETRLSYPVHLQAVTKIREVEEIEGTSYREIYFNNKDKMIKENNITNDDKYAIKKISIKGMTPKVSLDPKNILGKKFIDSLDNVTAVAHRIIEKKHDVDFNLDSRIRMKLIFLRNKRQTNFKLFSKEEPCVANRIHVLTKLQDLIVAKNSHFEERISLEEKELLQKYEKEIWEHPQFKKFIPPSAADNPAQRTVNNSIRI